MPENMPAWTAGLTGLEGWHWGETDYEGVYRECLSCIMEVTEDSSLSIHYGDQSRSVWFACESAQQAINAADALVRALEGRPDPGLEALKAEKDGAYLERNKCVALLASLAKANGWKVGRCKTAIEGWSEDWHGCVRIELPTGQVSWHYHDSQADLFAFLPEMEMEWDGHDTEEKYRRVLEMTQRQPDPELERLRRIELAAKALLYSHNFWERLSDAGFAFPGEYHTLEDALAPAQKEEPDAL